MRDAGRSAVVVLALLLAIPAAAAWPASLVATGERVSLRDSLLLAGALDASAPAGVFGAPRVEGLFFGDAVVVAMCADTPDGRPTSSCATNETTTAARFYVHSGGVVVQPPPDAQVTLRATATAAALGGPNLTLNAVPLPPALFSGGATAVESTGDAFTLRPLGSDASIEVRGDQGFRTYNGTGYTLFVSQAEGALLEARGAFLGAREMDVALSRAGVAAADEGIHVDELYELLRAVQPPESADRRADLAEAFGPFQLVAPLLDGAAAARANLTLDGEPQDGFVFLRVEDLRLSRADDAWQGSGNASYIVADDVLTPRPGATTSVPLVVSILLVAGAVVGRVLTDRKAAQRPRRRLAWLLRLGGLALMAGIASAFLAPLLGFSPLLDVASLGARSRVQLALLALGMALAAYAAVGLPAESLARSAYAWRDRPRAVVVAALVGLAATLLFLAFASATLLSVVARVVRL